MSDNTDQDKKPDHDPSSDMDELLAAAGEEVVPDDEEVVPDDEEEVRDEEQVAPGAPVDERPAAVPAAGKPRGRGIAWLSLLVSFSGFAVAGYLYYLLVVQQPLAPFSTQLAGIEAQAGEMAQDLKSIQTSQADALVDFTRQRDAELIKLRESLLRVVNQATQQAPPSSLEWRTAEVAYLLRIANHRLLMERDVDAARTLLGSADAILAELDNFSFYQVRAALAAELLALQNVESNDVQGIFLRLEAVKRRLGEELPLRVPEYLNARAVREAAQQQAQPVSVWDALRRELSRYLRIRTLDTDVKPLLAPQEAEYLELNLRLMLERAQLAALRGEQIVYQKSLESAAAWLAEYLDTEDVSVAHAIEELTELVQVNLEMELPDISASLTALKAVRGEP